MTRVRFFAVAAACGPALLTGMIAARSEPRPLLLAQAGSFGGTIGKENKSLSGNQEESRPTRAAPRARSAPARRTGGNSFDGAWSVQSTGQNCPISSTTGVVVSGGRIVAQGVTGSVSPSGGVSTMGAIGSVTVTSSGRLSGRGGAGTFRQSDGCVGRWVASKQ